MDRKGKQKIGFLCLTFGIIVLLTAVFFCHLCYGKKLMEKQKKELSVIYPELADELSENISYYTAKSMQADFLMLPVVLLLITIALTGTFFLLASVNHRRFAKSDNELNYIYE